MIPGLRRFWQDRFVTRGISRCGVRRAGKQPGTADAEKGPSPMAADPADDLPAPPRVPATALATLDADRLAPADVAATLRFAEAQNTRRAYAADWADFCRWAAARRAAPCPARRPRVQLPRHPGRGRPPRLDHRPPRRRGRHMHRAAGFDSPSTNPAVREVLRGIRRELGTAPQSKTPATADLIARMLAACPTTLIGLRDWALLAVGFAGALRRSEVLALGSPICSRCRMGCAS